MMASVQATTSGTTKDFKIPSGVKKVTVVRTTIAFILLVLVVPPSFAVDPTITPYCRGDAATEHVNFCAAVANNKSLASEQGKPAPTPVEEPSTE